MRHQTRLCIVDNHRYHKQYGQRRKRRRKQPEKMHRLICLVHPGNRPEHLNPVGKRIQLRNASCRAVAVFYHRVFHLHIFVSGMDAHFRFYFKSFGKHRERFDKQVAKRAVPRHHIFDIRFKQHIDRLSHQRISKIMERPLIFGKISGRKPVPHYHIRIFPKNHINHIGRSLRRICVVPVRNDVAFRVNIPKHPAYHVALSLFVFVADNSPRFFCNLIRPVRGIVVVYINCGFGQNPFKIFYYFADCPAFIITGNQYCYFIHVRFPSIFSSCGIRSISLL